MLRHRTIDDILLFKAVTMLDCANKEETSVERRLTTNVEELSKSTDDQLIEPYTADIPAGFGK